MAAIFDPEQVKDIHELEDVSSLSGKEEIIVDDGEVTRKMSLDALLGFFTQRISGDTSDSIDVGSLATASCIHVIPYGEDIPVERRIKGHYYIQIASNEDNTTVSSALFQDSNGKYFTFRNRQDDIVNLMSAKFSVELPSNSAIERVRLMDIEIKDPKFTTWISESFYIVLGYSDHTVMDTISFTCNWENDFKNPVFSATSNNGFEVICTWESETKISLWIKAKNVKVIRVAPVVSVGWAASDDTTFMLAVLFENYKVRYAYNNFNEDTDIGYSDTFLANIIAQTVIENKDIIDEMNALESMIIKTEIDPIFNSVLFSSVMVPSTEQILPANNIRYIDADKVFLKMNPDGSVSVARDGYYTLSLKQAMKMVTGKMILTMNVYVNNTKVEDLTYHGIISWENYAYCMSGNVTLLLHENDTIKVTWSANISALDSLTFANESSLQINKIMDVKDPVYFGNVGQELMNINALGGASKANLYAGLNTETTGTDMYEYPLVDKAKVDQSSLVEPK